MHFDMSMLQFYDVVIVCKIAKILKKYDAIFNLTNEWVFVCGPFVKNSDGLQLFCKRKYGLMFTAEYTLYTVYCFY